MYINSIFFHNGVQFVMAWRNVYTQEMSYGTMNQYNNTNLAKNDIVCKEIFNMIVKESCSFGTSSYADLFI